VKLGIIVPYRDRSEHLKIFLSAIKSILVQQEIDYEIFIVEQSNDKPFNRGMLLNIGARLAESAGCTYICLHDVDKIPEEVNYSYEDFPILLATDEILENGDIIKNPRTYFSGVVLFPLEQFKEINGYSNEYWGWGFEDDDLFARSKTAKLKLFKNKEKIYKKSTTGLKFNGFDSFVKSPMPYTLNNYTILISFKPDLFKCNPLRSVDTFPIFLVNDEKITNKSLVDFTYSSFKRYTYKTKSNKKDVTISTDIIPPYQNVFCITVNQFDKKCTIFQNGNLLSTHTFEGNTKIRGSSDLMFFLGNNMKDIDNGNQFEGTIDYFAVFNHSLEPGQIQKISTDSAFGLTETFEGYMSSHSLEVLYDMKIGTNSKLFDLSGNNRHGEVFHCDRVPTSTSTYVTQYLPFRRPCLFKSLSHSNNGYNHRTHKWKTTETRKNQIRFYNETSRGKVDFNKDGLSTVQWEEISNVKKDKVNYIKVSI
jgi:hypothetical protein